MYLDVFGNFLRKIKVTENRYYVCENQKGGDNRLCY